MAVAKKKTIELKQLVAEEMNIRVVGLPPGLLTRRFSEASLAELKPKDADIKVPYDPGTVEGIMESAIHHLAVPVEGAYGGIPSIAFKHAAVKAGFRVADYKGTDLTARMDIFGPDDQGGLIPIFSSPPEMDVRWGGKPGSAIKVVRPKFTNWSATLHVIFYPVRIKAEEVVALINLGGQCIGVGSFRPEKNGPFGRYRVEGSN